MFNLKLVLKASYNVDFFFRQPYRKESKKDMLEKLFERHLVVLATFNSTGGQLTLTYHHIVY